MWCVYCGLHVYTSSVLNLKMLRIHIKKIIFVDSIVYIMINFVKPLYINNSLDTNISYRLVIFIIYIINKQNFTGQFSIVTPTTTVTWIMYQGQNLVLLVLTATMKSFIKVCFSVLFKTSAIIVSNYFDSSKLFFMIVLSV